MTRPAAPDVDELAEGIALRAAARGLRLEASRLRALAEHARRVLEAAATLHLTTLTEPALFLERHVGEGFDGAAMLEETISGSLLDLGSGNGYPGLPVVAARPGLRACLAEAGSRKAEFLRGVLDGWFAGGQVIECHVQRANDVTAFSPFVVITSRAVGGWERVLPRLAPALARGGQLLVWAGAKMDQVSRRTAWRRYELLERKAIPDRDRSWVWRFAHREAL